MGVGRRDPLYGDISLDRRSRTSVRAPARGAAHLADNTSSPYENLRDWLRINALTAHIACRPSEQHEPYLATVARLGPDPSITYIRLNLDATAAQ